MSAATPAQPETQGAFSQKNAPQVVVRAGKTFLCAACGTMVEVPADVVGQWVITVNHPTQEEPPRGQAASKELAGNEPADGQSSRERAEEFPTAAHPISHRPSVLTEDAPSGPARQKSRPPRPKRPKNPKPEGLTSALIDGLKVPSAKQLDRALAWVSFHLKVLDCQGSELRRLKKRLKTRTTNQAPSPLPRPHGQAKQAPAQPPQSRSQGKHQQHAHEDVNMAPGGKNANDRGPP